MTAPASPRTRRAYAGDLAAWLTWLKSRLLVPGGDDIADPGERAAEDLAERLRELAEIRTLAAWLADRPILGR